MDILAHTLWANAGARAANTVAEKKGKRLHISPGWAAFWGVFPDFFAFTIPFVIALYRLVFEHVPVSMLHDHHHVGGGFDIAAYLYQYSHSLVIWAAVFVLVWIWSHRPRWELLAWALHILIDIPSHAIGFYPTPFLFPVSEYRFPYGIPWSNTWYMFINYVALAAVWGTILYKKYKTKVVLK